MRVVIQKVSKAHVEVNHTVVGSIGAGLLVLLGVHKDDNESDIDTIIKKILETRMFPNESGEKYFDISLKDTAMDILVVSQFTLYANLKKGRRPSFDNAASPIAAKNMYKKFLDKLRNSYTGNISTGIFQAHMEVSLTNTGPVTFIYDSRLDI